MEGLPRTIPDAARRGRRGVPFGQFPLGSAAGKGLAPFYFEPSLDALSLRSDVKR